MTFRTTTYPTGRLRAALILACVAGAAAMATPAPAAEVVTEAQIAEALTPRPATRSLSVGPRASQEDVAFLDSLRAARARPLSQPQRDRLASLADLRPGIDLDIPFDLGSSAISAKARPVIDALGAALSRPNLKDGTYLIAGHTDASGNPDYNLVLSDLRAAAVKQYLVAKFKLPAANLITAGYGKTRLKDADHPLADQNRRVQTTNLTDVRQASR